jgi:hypothetical protein
MLMAPKLTVHAYPSSFTFATIAGRARRLTHAIVAWAGGTRPVLSSAIVALNLTVHAYPSSFTCATVAGRARRLTHAILAWVGGTRPVLSFVVARAKGTASHRGHALRTVRARRRASVGAVGYGWADAACR